MVDQDLSPTLVQFPCNDWESDSLEDCENLKSVALENFLSNWIHRPVVLKIEIFPLKLA